MSREDDPAIPRLWLRALAVAAAMVLAAITASSAAAQSYWASSPDRVDIVNRFVYAQSPTAIPSAYDPVAEAEAILRQRQSSLIAGSAESRTIWTQTRWLTEAAGVSTPVRLLGTVGLAAGTFEIGWKIGSGINAKFLHIGVPEAIPATPTDFRGNGYAQQLIWHDAGFSPYFDRVIQPEAGFTWTRQTDSGRYYWRTGFPEVTCDMNRVMPPSGLTVISSAYPAQSCGYGSIRPSTDYHLAYVPDGEMHVVGPIESYNGQSYSKATAAPTPPSQSQVEQAIESGLQDPSLRTLSDWLDYELGEPGATDPTGNGPDNPEIAFPKFLEKWEQHGHEFAAPYLDPHEYYRDAADIVRRGDSGDPGVVRCEGGDGVYYWDFDRQAIVLVRDGAIETYFPPDRGFDYWLEQCN